MLVLLYVVVFIRAWFIGKTAVVAALNVHSVECAHALYEFQCT